MNGSPLQWYSHETAITKHYAYLLQQVEEALDLATHIWGRFEIDDKEEWERVPPLQEALQSAEKLALYYRSNEASLTRKETFSYLIFCRSYAVERGLSPTQRWFHAQIEFTSVTPNSVRLIMASTRMWNALFVMLRGVTSLPIGTLVNLRNAVMTSSRMGLISWLMRTTI